MSAAEGAELRESIARELELRDAVKAVSPPARGAREPFDPLVVSPSRLNNYVSCGVAFKLNYIDGVPAQRSGSAALFGSVVHLWAENWYADTSKAPVPLMRQAWAEFCKDTVIGEFLAEYGPLSAEAIAKEQEIRDAWAAQGRESKAPRMTGDWKKSEIARKVGGVWARWHERLAKESYYQFSDYDPLPALYDESLVLAEKYAARNRHLPKPLHFEFGLNAEWRGFVINAYIDKVCPVYDGGDLIALTIEDYKTYRQVPAPMKDWRQVVMYDAGLRSMVERGAIDLPTDIPWYVGIDYVRWTESWKNEDGTPHPPKRFWRVTEADHDRLESEMRQYHAAVTNGVFLPAEKGRKADFCDYPEQCCLRNCAAAGGGLAEVIL